MGYWQQLKQCNYFKNVLNFLVRKKVLTRKSSTRCTYVPVHVCTVDQDTDISNVGSWPMEWWPQRTPPVRKACTSMN